MCSPPSICPSTSAGLIATPQSAANTILFISYSPVSSLTVTSTNWAPYGGGLSSVE